mmetsp:Transcript_83346/g.166391  ORF Transcript_83346/g.166391 Transcript_83346/m.166391 type:complete len:171 (-) Transcript_83346:11-523(-)
MQAVLRAPRGHSFIMAEVGARWGPWGARAAAFAYAVRPDLDVRLHFVEPNPTACGGIRAVAELNGLHSTIECDKASPATFLKWAEGQEHVDVVDIDIQGHEQSLIPPIRDALSAKAYRVIIGTHGALGNQAGVPEANASRAAQKMQYCHTLVRRAFSDWILVNELEVQGS